jgi:hypothetical protein
MQTHTIPGTVELTVADLRRGDAAALTSDCAVLVRIRHADPVGSWGVRVEWDHGPGTRATVRNMPRENRVQVRR